MSFLAPCLAVLAILVILGICVVGVLAFLAAEDDAAIERLREMRGTGKGNAEPESSPMTHDP